MAIVKTNEYGYNPKIQYVQGYEKKKFQGLSTDDKPVLTENNSGSTFFCVDTVQVYIWHISQWYLVG